MADVDKAIGNTIRCRQFQSNGVGICIRFGLQTIMRIKFEVLSLKEMGSDIGFVIGIDLGVISREVLQELYLSTLLISSNLNLLALK